MRYEDHGAFKIFQGVHQHLLGRKIQVIGRFVEHQEVRRVVEHARYGQLSPQSLNRSSSSREPFAHLFTIRASATIIPAE